MMALKKQDNIKCAFLKEVHQAICCRKNIYQKPP